MYTRVDYYKLRFDGFTLLLYLDKSGCVCFSTDSETETSNEEERNKVLFSLSRDFVAYRFAVGGGSPVFSRQRFIRMNRHDGKDTLMTYLKRYERVENIHLLRKNT